MHVLRLNLFCEGCLVIGYSQRCVMYAVMVIHVLFFFARLGCVCVCVCVLW